MNIVSIGIGALALGFGIYMTYIRHSIPEKSPRLMAMKERFGDTRAEMIHMVAYTIVPVIFGTLFLVEGLLGRSLF